MNYPKILTVQDISCVGQCSLTVALPILSACGVETCALPSAVLSTHTCGFTGYTFRDLTEDMPPICKHWKKEGIAFDGIYTGYLGSAKQVEYVKDILHTVKSPCGRTVVDPAMADNGKLYVGFDEAFVDAMRSLCAEADYILPNLTEAALLAGLSYQPRPSREQVDALLQALCALGCRNVLLTGVSYREGKTGIVVFENGEYAYYEHDLLANSCHGTGDIYASAFVGALMRGKTAYAAAAVAADYVLDCIRTTAKLENHWYGAAFEPVLGKLIAALEA